MRTRSMRSSGKVPVLGGRLAAAGGLLALAVAFALPGESEAQVVRPSLAQQAYAGDEQPAGDVYQPICGNCGTTVGGCNCQGSVASPSQQPTSTARAALRSVNARYASLQPPAGGNAPNLVAPRSGQAGPANPAAPPRPAAPARPRVSPPAPPETIRTPPAAAAAPATNPTPPTEDLSQITQNYDAALAPQTLAPFMLGDAFGGPITSFTQFSQIQDRYPVSSGGMVGQTKLAENFSPMPRDRVYMNYSDFSGVPLNSPNSSVSRFTPGFEKTFYDRQMSFEMRLPFAATLDSTIQSTGPTGNDLQFGNIFMSYKALLTSSNQFALTSGMSMTVPTAQGVQFNGVPGAPGDNVLVRNQAVHLQPYGAFLYTPNNQFFMQGLFQVDVAANSTDVAFQTGAGAFTNVGKLHDQTLLYTSVSAGYWLYQGRSGRRITGFAPIFEVHQSQSVSHGSATLLPAGGFSVGNPNYVFSLLNATIGANMQMGSLGSLLMGYATPIGSGMSQQYNGEFRLMFNRRFGRQNRQTVAQF